MATRRRWLRDALRAWLPDDILDRPKRGFEVPIADWLRGDLRDHVHEVLLDPATLGRGWFREPEVRGLLDATTPVPTARRHACGRF